MNHKLNLRKIGVAILGIITVILGLMKGNEIFPEPNIENKQAEQATQQTISDKEKNTQIVDFNASDNNRATEKAKENVTDDSQPDNQRLTYEGKTLILTRHAECRMDCRKISKAEVMEVIDEGKENKRKSNPNDPRCPTIALEDWTEDGQLVRIIVADCDHVAKLVTVIDLKNDYDCYCE